MLMRGVGGAAEAEGVASGAGVPDAHGDVAAQLALDVDRVLLHARGALRLIDEVDGAADTGQQTKARARRLGQAVGKRVVDRRDRHEGVLLKRRDAGEAKLPVVGVVGRRVVPRRPEESVAGADDGVLIDGVHDAGARRQFHRGLVALHVGRAVDAGVDQAATNGIAPFDPDQIVQRADCILIEGDGDAIVLLADAVLVLDAQAEVQRHLRAQADVVLGVAAVVVDEHVEGLRNRDRSRARIPEQQIGHRTAARRRRAQGIGSLENCRLKVKFPDSSP